MKKLKIFLTFFIIMLGVFPALKAQENDAAELQQMFDTKNFIFKAETANPQSGRTRQLTQEYDLTISRDKIICFLPYYGRAYNAPVSSEGGIKFTSIDFTYDVKKVKKGWEITMIPKDVSDVHQMHLTAFTNGRATLQVTSNSRQNISFNGYVVKGKDDEKRLFDHHGARK
jgi:hypothetical protein